MGERAVDLACIIAGHSRKVDRSLSIRLVTEMEAPIELATWLDERQGLRVAVLIADDAEAQARSYRGEPNAKGQTPGQQLRNAIWGGWSAMRDRALDVPEWKQYYNQRMQEIINHERYGG